MEDKSGEVADPGVDYYANYSSVVEDEKLLKEGSDSDIVDMAIDDQDLATAIDADRIIELREPEERKDI